MAMMSCVIVRVKFVVMPSRMRRHKHQHETLRSMVDSQTSLAADCVVGVAFDSGSS